MLGKLISSVSAITYRNGYKYQLGSDFEILTKIQLDIDGEGIDDSAFLRLEANGLLTIQEGYAWDGPSGPTIDTANFMLASLVHDALYQLMRHGLLDGRKWRRVADRTFYNLCRRAGMSWVRAQYVYRCVRWFAKSSTMPKMKKKVFMSRILLTPIDLIMGF